MRPRASPPQAIPPQPTHPEPGDDTEFHRQILRELVEMAADIARAIHRDATTTPKNKAIW